MRRTSTDVRVSDSDSPTTRRTPRRRSSSCSAAPISIPLSVAMTASISSGFTSTSRALEPSLGPTTPRLSMMSIRRPALAKPTRSLRCSIEVEPNWVETTSSMAWMTSSMSSPMSSSISRLDAAGAVTSSTVRRLELGLAVLDDLVDLGLGDPGTLHADGLARSHRQEQSVTLTDELLGAGLVEDDAAVGDRGRGERQPRRHVGLDQAGHDVDRGPLGGEHQVDAGGTGELGDADDASSTSRGATIIRSASSSTTTRR